MHVDDFQASRQVEDFIKTTVAPLSHKCTKQQTAQN